MQGLWIFYQHRRKIDPMVKKKSEPQWVLYLKGPPDLLDQGPFLICSSNLSNSNFLLQIFQYQDKVGNVLDDLKIFKCGKFCSFFIHSFTWWKQLEIVIWVSVRKALKIFVTFRMKVDRNSFWIIRAFSDN